MSVVRYMSELVLRPDVFLQFVFIKVYTMNVYDRKVNYGNTFNQ